jgi:hypothetical protein
MASDWAVVTMPEGASRDDYEDSNVRLMTKNCTDSDPSAWPFANAVKAGVSSVMCSYNRINGSYGCQNSKLLNGVLKEELGFQGYGKNTSSNETRSVTPCTWTDTFQ